MSLILEALKKSEAQRQLGEMPNLGTPISATRRRRSPMPWLALTVVVALAAVGGWEFLRHRSAPAPVAGPSDAAKAGPTHAAATTPAAAPRQSPKPPASAPANQTITSIPAPAPPAPVKKETAPPPPPPVPAQAAAKPNAPPAAAPVAPAPAPTPEPEAPVATAPPPAPAPAAPPVSDVPTIDDLPPDVRGALPVLPISMQVYSPDPKRRFVIIDGKRVVEGDSLSGVTVQEIRPSGLVIDFHGRRVLLPRPGT